MIVCLGREESPTRGAAREAGDLEGTAFVGTEGVELEGAGRLVEGRGFVYCGISRGADGGLVLFRRIGLSFNTGRVGMIIVAGAGGGGGSVVISTKSGFSIRGGTHDSDEPEVPLEMLRSNPLLADEEDDAVGCAPKVFNACASRSPRIPSSG